jgi:hypothetical protein
VPGEGFFLPVFSDEGASEDDRERAREVFERVRGTETEVTETE